MAQKVYCQVDNYIPQKAWVLKDISLKTNGGWHTVVDIMDIIDFKCDSLLTIKNIGIDDLQYYKYKVDQKKERLIISEGSEYHLKLLSDSSLTLMDGSSTFFYTILKDTKNVISIDSAINNLLYSAWSYDSIDHDQKLEFSTDKFFIGNIDTGLMKFTETSLSDSSPVPAMLRMVVC